MVCGSPAHAARLLFESRTETGSQLFSVNADGTNQKQLTFPGTEHFTSYSAKWNAQVGRIAFMRSQWLQKKPKISIWTMRPDGSDQQRVKGSESVKTFAWSPSGDRFIFAREFEGRPQLCVLQLPHTAPEVVMDDRRFVFNIAFAPSGERIALGVGPNADLYVSDVNLSRLIKLTPQDYSGQINAISFSPDEKSLVFSGSKNQRAGVYRAEVDGSQFQRLSPDDKTEYCGHWRPNGKRIVFVSAHQGHLSLFSVKPDGTDRRRLTRGLVWDQDPISSPNGERIAWSREETPGQMFIYVMNADGTKAHRVSSQGWDWLSAWLPGRNPDVAPAVANTKRGSAHEF